jgi:hypothetical protein
MNSFVRSALAALCLLSLATPAGAQIAGTPAGGATAANQTSQITQATTTNTNLGAKADAAWSGTGDGTLLAIQKYIAAKVEASRALLAGTLTVSVSGTPAVTVSGVSTAANQTTANGSLSSIDTKLSSQATAANQTTGNGSLSSIDTKLSSQATAANQTSANTKLDQVHTDLTAATPAGTNLIGKVGIDQTTPGATNGMTIAPSAASAVGIAAVASTSAEACHVFKASAGNLYSVSGTIGAAGWIMVFNATSAPADGAVTPVAWAQPTSSGSWAINYGTIPLVLSTGITVCASSTGPLTKTAYSTNTVFSGRVQ